jgi:hypothetical protein
MKVHIAARDQRDLAALRPVADQIGAPSRPFGSCDFLLFSDDDDSFVNIVSLSPSVARRLGGPGLCEHGRAALMREVVEAVKAETAGRVPTGEAVH